MRLLNEDPKSNLNFIFYDYLFELDNYEKVMVIKELGIMLLCVLKKTNIKINEDKVFSSQTIKILELLREIRKTAEKESATGSLST